MAEWVNEYWLYPPGFLLSLAYNGQRVCFFLITWNELLKHFSFLKGTLQLKKPSYKISCFHNELLLYNTQQKRINQGIYILTLYFNNGSTLFCSSRFLTPLMNDNFLEWMEYLPAHSGSHWVCPGKCFLVLFLARNSGKKMPTPANYGSRLF